MKRKPLFKYQLGLLIVGVFTLLLAVMVLVQAGSTKADAATDKQANAAAEKLNTYVNDTQTIPANLAEAGYSEKAATIHYTRLSETQYKFCATYKANSNNFDATGVATSLASGGSVDNNSYDFTGSTYLYISTSHHKGENCQTITPSLYGGVGCSPACGSPSSDGSNFVTDLGGNATKAEDVQRQTDINALDAHLEAYYASNGFYPTLAELNSSTWRATNLKGLDPSALCDPSATSTTDCSLTLASSKGSYSYNPSIDNTKVCTVSGECQYFSLTATLSTGRTYDKSSL